MDLLLHAFAQDRGSATPLLDIMMKFSIMHILSVDTNKRSSFSLTVKYFFSKHDAFSRNFSGPRGTYSYESEVCKIDACDKTLPNAQGLTDLI